MEFNSAFKGLIFILDICLQMFVFYVEFRLWQAKFHTHTKVQISHKH
jgi:hypothetical protein